MAAAAPARGHFALTCHKSSSGMARAAWQRVKGVDLASEYPRFQSTWEFMDQLATYRTQSVGVKATGEHCYHERVYLDMHHSFNTVADKVPSRTKGVSSRTFHSNKMVIVNHFTGLALRPNMHLEVTQQKLNHLQHECTRIPSLVVSPGC